MTRKNWIRQRWIRQRYVLALALVGSLLAVSAEPSAAAVVEVHLNARPASVWVAPGVRMRAWTFNGTVPGPIIHAGEGDTVEVTLHNGDVSRKGRGGMWHSVDFHAAQIAPDLAFKGVAPGKTFTFSFLASRPGVYLYHCGAAPLLQHIGMGMYGAIIVDPAASRPPAREITLIQSEFYGALRDGVLRPSLKAMRTQRPRYVAFNGFAERYVRHPISVPVGQPVRIYLIDAGPTLESDFHVVGSIFESFQQDGNPEEPLHWVSTQLVPPGGSGVFELTFPQAGVYPFLTHAVRWADAGAVGRFVAR